VGERLNEYELLYILSPRVPSDEVTNAIERVNTLITSAGGEVTSVDNWGRRRLAYPIRQYFEGTYVVLTLNMPPAGASGLEASLVISDEVIRHMLTSGVIERTSGGRSRSEEFERGDDRGPSDRPSADGAPPEAAPAAEAAAPAGDAEAAASDEASEPETQPVAAAAE
jgi:small subunit ribosomal protein S6